MLTKSRETRTTGTKHKSIVYYYDDSVGNYYYGQNHPMKPHRIRMTHSLVVNYGLYKDMQIFRPYRLEEKDLTLFHSDDYVHFLKSVSLENQESWGADLEKFNIDVDCPIFDGLYEFCQISSGGSVGGAYKLNHGQCDIAINWSGGLHHAKKSEASGFCYMNDIVLSILELLKYHDRVLYIDIDIHHGDGVEEAFYTTDRVMTLSFHKYGEFFPGTGSIIDKGINKGENYSINVPLDEGIDNDSYTYIFKPILNKIIKKYNPNVIVMQLGADSLAGDRLGCFNLTTLGHGACLEYVKSFNLPLLVLGGGGYTLRNVSRCWTYETAICCNKILDNKIPYNEYYEYFAPDYTLTTLPTNMVNCNNKKKLDNIIQTVYKYLQNIEISPNTQIEEKLKNKDGIQDTINQLNNYKYDLIKDKNLDTNINNYPKLIKEQMVQNKNEFYEDEKDQDKINLNTSQNNNLSTNKNTDIQKDSTTINNKNEIDINKNNNQSTLANVNKNN